MCILSKYTHLVANSIIYLAKGELNTPFVVRFEYMHVLVMRVKINLFLKFKLISLIFTFNVNCEKERLCSNILKYNLKKYMW